MPDHTELTAIAVVGLAALIGGLILTRMRQPAVVGYILAGVILGPSAAGVVEDRTQINALAELGVLMLLFLIGMELRLRSFLKVWRTALFCTLAQIGASVAVMLGLSELLGWPLGLSVLLGFVVALSSTAVAIKMLEEIGELKTETGQITVAVLIAQDLAVVPMMLVIHELAGAGFGTGGLAKIVLSLAVLVLLVLYLSRRDSIRLPLAERVVSHVDLTPLAALALCLGAAALSGLVGLSPAYGAFLAGLVIGNSAHRAAMIRSTQPIQSILLMVFFLSVGLLMDLGYIWENLGKVALLLVIVTVFKTALNVAALRLLGEPLPRASLAGVVLAQVGEFSFVLAAIAVTTGLIGTEESRLIVAIVALSLIISPLWLETARRLHRIMALGITSFREIMRLVYGREAALLVEGSHRVERRSHLIALALNERIRNLRRRARSATRAQAGNPPKPAGAAKSKGKKGA